MSVARGARHYLMVYVYVGIKAVAESSCFTARTRITD
jgi:hypothetical protein